MNILLVFFLKYLLVPLFMVAAMFVLNALAKGKAVLKMKKLVVFVMLLALVLALPSLLGLLAYEFVWGGLVISIMYYLSMGALFNQFSKSRLFKSIGLKDNPWLVLLALLVSAVLAGWLYYLVFDWLSGLGYALLAMLAVGWFLAPPLFAFAMRVYLAVPSPFYKLWVVERGLDDDAYWDSVDTFSLMQVAVKIKRAPEDPEYASFSVKLPKDVALGRWFNRFVEDQNIRFPNKAIAMEGEEGPYGWILYTSRWLPIPIFTKLLDMEGDAQANKVKNKATLYVRRVARKHEEAKKQLTVQT